MNTSHCTARSRRKPGAWALLLLTLSILTVGTAGGWARGSLRAQVSQTRVTVGEPFTYSLTFEYGGEQATTTPQAPDWGGLTMRQGPSLSRQIFSGMGGTRFVLSYQWELVGTADGQYTIGPGRMQIGGDTLESQPITVTIGPPPTDQLPADLQGELILPARTRDNNINKALLGRMFMRTEVSTTEPFVGQPVLVTYSLYIDRVTLRQPLKDAVPDVQGALKDELFHANSIDFETVQMEGRTYQVAKMYQMTVTPTKSGELEVPGYTLVGNLSQQRRQDPFGSVFGDMFDDPFFGGGLEVEIPGAPVKLNAKPIPPAGQPTDFTGTVGDFTISVKLDQDKITEDDVVTLSLILSGKGAIELANRPVFPSQGDFELLDQSAQADKKIVDNSPGGSKTFELILRPLRSGNLTVPSIRYPIFDPFSGSYKMLQTNQMTIQVAPGTGAGSAAQGMTQSLPLNTSVSVERQLHYIKPLGALTTRRPDALIESPWLWLGLLALLGLTVITWRREVTLSRLNPTQVRRTQAWPRFQKTVQQIKRQGGQEEPAELAIQAEQAVRQLLADRFDRSPDGLTRPEIEQLLNSQALAAERIATLCDLLDQCQTLRYAPTSARQEQVRQWLDAMTDILKEALAS